MGSRKAQPGAGLDKDSRKQLAALLRAGATVVRQKGSHIQVRLPNGEQHTFAPLTGRSRRNRANRDHDLRRRGTP